MLEHEFPRILIIIQALKRYFITIIDLLLKHMRDGVGRWLRMWQDVGKQMEKGNFHQLG